MLHLIVYKWVDEEGLWRLKGRREVRVRDFYVSLSEIY